MNATKNSDYLDFVYSCHLKDGLPFCSSFIYTPILVRNHKERVKTCNTYTITVFIHLTAAVIVVTVGIFLISTYCTSSYILEDLRRIIIFCIHGTCWFEARCTQLLRYQNHTSHVSAFLWHYRHGRLKGPLRRASWVHMIRCILKNKNTVNIHELQLTALSWWQLFQLCLLITWTIPCKCLV